MEESHFEKYQHKTVMLYVEPLLDTYNKTYVSALTLNTMPEGPLQELVKVYNTPKLSTFQTFTNTINRSDNCTYIIMKYPNGNKAISTNWMLSDDISAVFSYLQANDYNIDISLTKLINRSKDGYSVCQTGNRRVVCMFSFSK